MLLPDVNVWVALAFDSHRHHAAAFSWFKAAPPESCCFCRVTQQGFLRLATTPAVMMDGALTLREAWAAYDGLYHDPRLVFADEPPDIERVWRALTQRDRISHKVWTDAYLAAFAQTAGLEVVTFDRGFAQYAGIRCTILS